MPDPYTCQLCRPPQPVGDGELDDHLRLLHPERYETLRAAGRRPDPPPGEPFTRPVREELAVCECGRLLYPGDPYAERVIGVDGGLPVVEVTCVECGEAPPIG